MGASSLITGVSSSTALKFMLGPYLDLSNSINSLFILKRERLKNTILIVFLIASMLAGAILPFFSPEYKNFILLIASQINIPEQLLVLFTVYGGAWLLSYPTSWLISSCMNIIFSSNCCYGDANYYLTKHRLENLVKISGEKQQDWLDLFIFLRSKFRSIEKNDDPEKIRLQNILNSFMYSPELLVTNLFDEEIRNYKISLWQQGFTQDLLAPNRITRISELYKERSGEVLEVLRNCIKDIQNTPKSEQFDPQICYNIIVSLQSGNIEAIELYNTHQNLINTKRKILQNKMIKHIQELNELDALKIKPEEQAQYFPQFTKDLSIKYILDSEIQKKKNEIESKIVKTNRHIWRLYP